MTLNNKMNALTRREKILELLNQDGAVNVKNLVDFFCISEVTIRNDLKKLESEGKLIRFHGGAQSLTTLPNSLSTEAEISLEGRYDLNSDSKSRIADRARKFVSSGDTIIFDSGSTTQLVAQSLKDVANLVVITNNLPVADVFAEARDCSIVVTGGLYRSKTKSLHGHIAESSLDKVIADTLFIGADGIDAEHGITTFNDGYAISQVMASCAKRVIAVVDSSKFGRVGFNRVLASERIDILITDLDAKDTSLDEFRKKGVTVITV